MAIKLFKTEDKLEVKNVMALLYGPPGVGKTTMAYTSDSPLLIAFDKGYRRSDLRKDSAEVDFWEDVLDLVRDKSVLGSFNTFILDDIGSMQHYIKDYLKRTGNNLVTGDGGLSQRGWGKLSLEFQKFFQEVRNLEKDIVIIAHDKDYKEPVESNSNRGGYNNNDNMITRYKPDIQGSTYKHVFRYLDLVGFITLHEGKRILSFKPNDIFVTKDCAGIGSFYIPDFLTGDEEADKWTLKSILDQTKQKLSGDSYAQQRNLEIIKVVKDNIASASEIGDFIEIQNHLNGLENSNEIKRQVATVLFERLNEVGIEFNKDTKEFSKIEKVKKK